MLSELDQLQDLYDVVQRSIERARGTKLTRTQIAEVEHREALMETIAAEILSVKGASNNEAA